MSKLAEMGINESLWKELMTETLDEHQKDLQKIGRSELKRDIKVQKEWNKTIKELVKTNDEAVKHLEKGFTELNKVTQEGLEETGEAFEKLADSASISKPSLMQLKISLGSQIFDDQLGLMQSLLELSQSEGVQGIMKFLAAMFNGVLTNQTQLTKFATNLSNLLGTTLAQNVDFSAIKNGMKALNEVRTSLFEELASIISEMITKVASYPAVFQVILDVTNILIGVLKGLETNLKDLEVAIENIDEWIRKIFSKWGFLFDTEYLAQGNYDYSDYSEYFPEGMQHEILDSDGDGIPDYQEEQIPIPKPDADVSGDLLRGDEE